jgi:ribosomal protein L37AE/L43A
MTRLRPTLLCPVCAEVLTYRATAADANAWRCANCGFCAPGNATYAELISSKDNPTANLTRSNGEENLAFLTSSRTTPQQKPRRQVLA